ncbi:MAG: hypothetical protein ACLVAE_12940, partial [Evtepia gabavorous]|uniref:hypothetical protein n=1 Tax=Evtepia gabavorous TaxID=2211183 RepID=UPI00399C20C9
EHQAQNLLLGESLIHQCFAPQFPTDFTRNSHGFFSGSTSSYCPKNVPVEHTALYPAEEKFSLIQRQ